MGHALRNRTGTSLIEICLALAVITLASLLVMTFSRNTLGMTKDARSIDAAYQSAQDLVDSLSAEPFPQSGSDTDSGDNIDFTREWEVVDSPYVSFVKVEVSFTSLNGAVRTISLTGAI